MREMERERKRIQPSTFPRKLLATQMPERVRYSLYIFSYLKHAKKNNNISIYLFCQTPTLI